jgi:hypothetical protein
MTNITRLQLRRGLAADWTLRNEILRQAEPGFEIDTGKIKYGDGTTPWNTLPYATGDVQLSDLLDVSLVDPLQNNQSLVYNDGSWTNDIISAAAFVSKTRPSPANDGDLWFDPEDGRLYRYYVDTDSTAQWVEIKQAPATSSEQSNTFISPVAMYSTLNVNGTTTLGNASVQSTLAVTGPTTLSSTLAVTGSTTLNSTLAVSGTVTATGNVNPQATNSYDLGTSSLRWRNIYTQDLHLSNGIGDYTVVEGIDELYLVNNNSGKHFKFALIEVDPSEVPKKSESD